MESVRKGAISCLPKEKLAELDELLNAILAAHERGESPWKLLFEKLRDPRPAAWGYELGKNSSIKAGFTPPTRI